MRDKLSHPSSILFLHISFVSSSQQQQQQQSIFASTSVILSSVPVMFFCWGRGRLFISFYVVHILIWSEMIVYIIRYQYVMH